MTILIDETTPVIVQGFTGRIGSFHAQEMMDYGTKVVGGVTPGRAARRIWADRCSITGQDAVRATGASASMFRAAALCRGLDHGSGRCRDRAMRRDHRRHPGPGHDPVKRYMRRYKETAHAADRSQLRRHHQPGQGHDGDHARSHLHPGLGRDRGAFRDARLRGRLAAQGLASV